MEHKGFFAALFDLSFSELVTTKIIKVLYVLGLIGAGIYSLILLVMMVMSSLGLSQSNAAMGILLLLLSLVVTPLIFLVFVIAVRVYMEMIIIMFRIADNTAEIVQMKRAKSGPTEVSP